MAQELKGFAEHYSGFKRHWKLALFTFLLTMSVGIAITLSLPDVYRSSAFILIEESEIPEELLRSTVTTYAARQVTTLNERILTIDTLTDIINRFNLFPEERDSTPIEFLALEVRQNINVELQSRDSIGQTGVPQALTIGFTVSFDNEDPQSAKAVADELVSLYLDQNLKTRAEQTIETEDFLSDQVDTLNVEIALLENELASFKEENSKSLPSLNTLNLQMMNRIDSQLLEIDRQLRVIDENRIALNVQLATVEPTSAVRLADGSVALGPSEQLKALQTQLSLIQSRYSENHPDVIGVKRDIASLQDRFGLNVNLADLDQELNNARSDLAIAKERYSEGHPDVIALSLQVSELERQQVAISQKQLDSQVVPDNPAYISLMASSNSLDAEEFALLAQRETLSAKQTDYESRLVRTPQIEKDLAALSRELSSTTNRYWVMRDKQFAAQLGSTIETAAKGEEMVLIEPPRIPLRPFKPDRIAILALTFLFAMVAGLAVTQLVDSLDSSIRGTNSIVSVQGSPPLAEIPYIRTKAEAKTSEIFFKRFYKSTPAMILIALLFFHFVFIPIDDLLL
ncbi:MAG: hypothetical protein VYA80_03575 [Pseudomonadota bacterium]|nr:hypothetical protein [Pseudomonadota bacterium]